MLRGYLLKHNRKFTLNKKYEICRHRSIIEYLRTKNLSKQTKIKYLGGSVSAISIFKLHDLADDKKQKFYKNIAGGIIVSSVTVFLNGIIIYLLKQFLQKPTKSLTGKVLSIMFVSGAGISALFLSSVPICIGLHLFIDAYSLI
ncbi:MAG: hypothetical protein Dasosvirus6_2 [Dasosvirus sp.]|uniref:Uncharacterized protein n=1 Tax=Dasosvirus sp. TaxID=2487764 RepID=A0A3G4ZRK5_9VIRU|nr:MAG: hypothetical protein Dasosvirus6_2 [Dasosvirus sp.]